MMGIVEEEADESDAGCEHVVETGILGKKDGEELSTEANQLVAIPVTSIKTAQKNKVNN